MTEESSRLLGARDGLAHALIWVRDEIGRIDGIYAPRIHLLHTRKRKHRDDVLRPLRDLERRISDGHKECVAAYHLEAERAALSQGDQS